MRKIKRISKPIFVNPNELTYEEFKGLFNGTPTPKALEYRKLMRIDELKKKI